MSVDEHRHDDMETSPCKSEDTFQTRCEFSSRRKWSLGECNPRLVHWVAGREIGTMAHRA